MKNVEDKKKIVAKLQKLWQDRCVYGKYDSCKHFCDCKIICKQKRGYCAGEKEFEALSKEYGFTETGFYRDDGCAIPIEKRPYVCVTFLCPPVIKQMTQRERNLYSKLLKKLRAFGCSCLLLITFLPSSLIYTINLT